MLEGVTIPASRFRVMQFLDHFEALGHEVHVEAGYGARYNQLSATRLGLPYKIATRLKRIWRARRPERYDLVFLQRSTLPTSALPERYMFLRGARFVFDFDDHIGIGRDGRVDPARMATFHEVCRLSDQLIAGNQFLAEMADRPSRTTIIPTVIDASRYCPAPARLKTTATAATTRTIGWMGTASNFPSLQTALPALTETLKRSPRAKLRLISNATFEPLSGHPQVEQTPWRADREVRDLQSFDVGIMPLADTLANRGKCAFKMIQYMACATPVVASRVGANVEVFEGSEAGFCVENDVDTWVDSIMELLEHPGRAQEAGNKGRAHIESRYTIEAVLPRYQAVFDRALS